MTDIIYHILEKSFIKTTEKLIIESRAKSIKMKNAGVRFLVELEPKNWEEIGHFAVKIDLFASDYNYTFELDRALIEQQIVVWTSCYYGKEWGKIKSVFEKKDLEDFLKKLKQEAAPLFDIALINLIYKEKNINQGKLDHLQEKINYLKSEHKFLTNELKKIPKDQRMPKNVMGEHLLINENNDPKSDILKIDDDDICEQGKEQKAISFDFSKLK